MRTYSIEELLRTPPGEEDISSELLVEAASLLSKYFAGETPRVATYNPDLWSTALCAASVALEKKKARCIANDLWKIKRCEPELEGEKE